MEDLAGYYFHQGTNFRAYEYLGCHMTRQSDAFLYVFRVWAPNAKSVSVVGDFCSWNHPLAMKPLTNNGVYELSFLSSYSLENQNYKYLIVGKDGKSHYKGDPYAAMSRGLSDGASVIFCESDYAWNDTAWLKARKKKISFDGHGFISAPLNIYEVHFSSFIRGENDRILSYREMAEILVPYVKTMGYTHVEFLPLTEYPFDGSWGYQVGAFFAPSSRFGNPDDFRYLIDYCHKNGVGVILDWVPAHFPKDEWGLFEFDGQPLYEYQGKDRQESSSWGTRFFDLGREEVQSFLISNALYYLREFHIDGLRVDAVASMLYLDYDRKPGEWLPNVYGGRENLEAVSFIKKLNGAVLGELSDVLMIAEESTAFPGVTHPISQGGLGFSLKWNMGFANDFFKYLSMDPVYREYHHNALTFPLMYAFSENYVLPISHDEVVHGKHSFIDKMNGDYETKFKQARTALLLLMTYPGKKMLFMGTEFAQFREWDYQNSLEWFMLDYDKHREFRDFVMALNHFYLSHSELWDDDFSPYGFSWILPDENKKNAVAYKRRNRDGEELTVLLSFSGASESMRIPMSKGSYYRSLFSSHDTVQIQTKCLTGKGKTKEYADILLPPFSGVILREIKKKQTYKIPTSEI